LERGSLDAVAGGLREESWGVGDRGGGGRGVRSVERVRSLGVVGAEVLELVLVEKPEVSDYGGRVGAHSFEDQMGLVVAACLQGVWSSRRCCGCQSPSHSWFRASSVAEGGSRRLRVCAWDPSGIGIRAVAGSRVGWW